jgi:HPt (histidine-containing phosphotransfer) domain-containing protein
VPTAAGESPPLFLWQQGQATTTSGQGGYTNDHDHSVIRPDVRQIGSAARGSRRRLKPSHVAVEPKGAEPECYDLSVTTTVAGYETMISGEAFDRAIWDELIQVFGREGLAEMIQALHADLPLQQQRLAEALRAGDSEGLKQIAHSLRGVALQFGATRLVAQWSALEHCIANGGVLPEVATAATAALECQAQMNQSLYEALDAG